MTNDQVLLNTPELRVPQWIDAQGNPSRPLELADLGDGFKVIFCFQHGCPGCHSHGFPTLKALVEALSGQGFGFAAVQTVFEAAQINTFDRLRETQLRYGLAIPFGHDPAMDRYPSLMADFETRGTPWFIVIDPLGEVVHSDFRLNAERLLETFGGAGELTPAT
nr:TlpA family protein disulfide reductase [uncultured Albidiferax sp.]